MKSFTKTLMIIAFIAVIGFSMAACKNNEDDSSDSDGTFTVTDIPSEYNGKYAMFMDEETGIIGVQSIDMSKKIITLVQINGDKVSLPMWIVISESAVSKFTGDYTTTADKSGFLIYEKKTPDMESDEPIVTLVFNSVVFKNGSATKSWKDGTKQ